MVLELLQTIKSSMMSMISFECEANLSHTHYHEYTVLNTHKNVVIAYT
jgi:hypothetical protein